MKQPSGYDSYGSAYDSGYDYDRGSYGNYGDQWGYGGQDDGNYDDWGQSQWDTYGGDNQSSTQSSYDNNQDSYSQDVSQSTSACLVSSWLLPQFIVTFSSIFSPRNKHRVDMHENDKKY